ncbi:MAG: hypothetical protein LUH20_02045 [Lachnospiraceae bacterium]|nr:hypothetical protein [Lachnospiraceae bacterium]
MDSSADTAMDAKNSKCTDACNTAWQETGGQKDSISQRSFSGRQLISIFILYYLLYNEKRRLTGKFGPGISFSKTLRELRPKVAGFTGISVLRTLF